MANLWGKSWSKMDILRRVGDIRQIAHVEPFEWTDGAERGTRGVRVSNGSGVEWVVATDRGMAITQVAYQGVPLSFLTSVGVTHPAFSEPKGEGWLRTFPGGFCTPCGLNQVGSAGRDDGEELGLHGRVASIPAREVRWGANWKDDDYLLWVEGLVMQTAFFGEKISMRRRLWTWLGEPRFWIEDTIENQDFKPVPFMLMQHFNLGFPLVDAQAQLYLPKHETAARDENARQGVQRYLQFEDPTAAYQEQVFYHTLSADENGQATIRLVNPQFDGGKGLGVFWRYSLSDYPVLVEWKMMGEGNYVLGIEPANCHVEGRSAERSRGTLQTLQPFETRRLTMEVGFFR